MVIRFATPADEPAMVTACTKAFFDESLFGETMHPNRHQYPEDVAIYWHKCIRSHFRNPRYRILVNTVIVDGEEKVVGVATWERQGDDEGANKLIAEAKTYDASAFEPLKSTNNRAIDPSKRTILKDSWPFFKHHYDGITNGVPRMSNWYLVLLGVHPDFHGQGLARPLVHWGLERAREENVHASCCSSHGTDPFYLKSGFEEIVADSKEGEGNPMKLAGVKGGNILFMWAKQGGNISKETEP